MPPESSPSPNPKLIARLQMALNSQAINFDQPAHHLVITGVMDEATCKAFATSGKIFASRFSPGQSNPPKTPADPKSDAEVEQMLVNFAPRFVSTLIEANVTKSDRLESLYRIRSGLEALGYATDADGGFGPLTSASVTQHLRKHYLETVTQLRRTGKADGPIVALVNEHVLPHPKYTTGQEAIQSVAKWDNTQQIQYYTDGYTPEQTESVQRALNRYEDVANLHFLHVAPPKNVEETRRYQQKQKTLEFRMIDYDWETIKHKLTHTSSLAGYSKFPDSHDHFVRTVRNTNALLQTTVGHEIGHALGLPHGQDGKGFFDMRMLSPQYDNELGSIMTYNHGTFERSLTLGLYDHVELQKQYGPNLQTRAKDTEYVFNAETENKKSLTRTGVIYDAAGIDRLNLSALKTPSVALNASSSAAEAYVNQINKDQRHHITYGVAPNFPIEGVKTGDVGTARITLRNGDHFAQLGRGLDVMSIEGVGKKSLLDYLPGFDTLTLPTDRDWISLPNEKGALLIGRNGMKAPIEIAISVKQGGYEELIADLRKQNPGLKLHAAPKELLKAESFQQEVAALKAYHQASANYHPQERVNWEVGMNPNLTGKAPETPPKPQRPDAKKTAQISRND